MPDETPVGEATLETSTDAPASDALAPVAPEEPAPAKKTAARKTTAKKAAVKKTTTKRAATKKAAAPEPDAPPAEETDAPAPAPAAEAETEASEPAPAKKAAARKTAAKRTTTRKTAARKVAEPEVPADETAPDETADEEVADEAAAAEAPAAPPTMLVFQAPQTTTTVTRRTRKTTTARTRPAAEEPAAVEPAAAPAPEQHAEEPDAAPDEAAGEQRPARQGGRGGNRGGRGRRPAQDQGEPAESPATPEEEPDEESAELGEPQDDSHDTDTDEGEGGGGRRRRRRGGRRRRKSGDGDSGGDDHEAENGSAAASAGNGRGAGPQETDEADSDQDETGDGTSRRRRRRRRSGDDNGEGGDDPEHTVTRVRRPRSAEDEITAISGSTRLEAKKQRRRDGREAGRRRAPIVSEAEFLARRESVDRVMVIRQRDELTQIGVLEDKVLVEHYVARESQTSLIGNVYLGRVQNVLPSMEAAFIDIGKGRNAVLYAGEVNWSSLGHREGQPRKIESVLSSGQSVLVQVTKDPIGHKGARLTSQVSLAGRFLVYVPDGTTSGISRKLPDTERNRLKALLKEIVPDTAGVIVRTAAEGASEDELTRDVERLKARWEDIEAKSKGSAPQMLYGEPDLTLKVVRDLFTEDFARLVIEGDDAWDTVQGYVAHVAPDLQERLERYVPAEHNGKDIFATYRVEEQIAKGLDRKVWLPSGGSLVIDRTEAMTVVDVNTGKFTGSGGNLEETVTKNNLEAAEEIVRQLRLRDIGGIIVVDFIDMVLESNRDLVLRRLVECLGRDRTRHQVAEVTSLGLVQMTRKRIGTGLVESFSENCTHCQGRGVVIHDAPVEPSQGEDESRRGGARRTRGGRGRGENDGDSTGSGNGGANSGGNGARSVPSPKDVAAVAKPENAERSEDAEKVAPEAAAPAAEAPEASAPEAPASAPQVVTRTRRRSGGRGQEAAAPETPAPADEAPAPADEAPAPEPQAPVAQAPVASEAAAEEEAASPVTAPRVVTRTRRRSGGRGQEAAAPETPAPVVETPAPEAPAPVAAAPVAPEAAVEDEAAAPVTAPRVVTRTRRRSGAGGQQPAAPEVSGTPTSAPEEPEAPAASEAPEVAAEETPTPVSAPQVVTRTRRRAASRPAGPPAGATSSETGSADLEPAPDGADGHPSEHVEHVPVKKRSRKR